VGKDGIKEVNMVMKGGGTLPDPIEPKPKPKPWPPIEPPEPIEYPVVPTTAGIKRSVQRSRREGNVVRQTVIRGASISTGRNGRLRAAALVASLGLDETRAVVTVDGLVEMSDDLTSDIKAKYVLAPMTNGNFKLVSVSMPENVEAGETDALADVRIYTTKSIEATVRTIENKKMVAAELAAASKVSDVFSI